MLESLMITTPGRATRSAANWFSCATLGATGDVRMLGTAGEPAMKPRPSTLSRCPELRLLIASCGLVSLRVERPGTGGLGLASPPVEKGSLPSVLKPSPLKVESGRPAFEE